MQQLYFCLSTWSSLSSSVTSFLSNSNQSYIVACQIQISFYFVYDFSSSKLFTSFNFWLLQLSAGNLFQSFWNHFLKQYFYKARGKINDTYTIIGSPNHVSISPWHCIRIFLVQLSTFLMLLLVLKSIEVEYAPQLFDDMTHRLLFWSELL